jgi:YVTN family beta-propeller protein
VVAVALIAGGALLTFAGEDEEPGAVATSPPGRQTLELDEGAVTQIDVGGDPLVLAVGPDRIWVIRSDRAGAVLVPVDPAANATAGAPIPLVDAVGDRTLGVTAHEGAVWVLLGADDEADTPGEVRRIDPSTGETVATITVGADPRGITASSSGVWVTNAGDGTVSRIDPAANRVATTIAVGNGPGSIASGSSGVWVSNDFGDVALARIAPATDSVIAQFPDYALGAVGRTYVWAVGPGAPNGAVVRINPKTNSVVGDPFGVDIQPVFMAVLQRTVWVAKWFPPDESPSPNAPPSPTAEPSEGLFMLFRLDPRTMTLVGDPIAIDLQPSRPVAGFSALWVTSAAAGTVLRIDPAAVAGETPAPTATPTESPIPTATPTT